GMKSGILFGHGSVLCYDEVRNAPKKTFVGQFHCNPGGGRSLADHLSKDGGKAFVRDGYRCTRQNRRDIRMLLSAGDDLFGTSRSAAACLPARAGIPKPLPAVDGL